MFTLLFSEKFDKSFSSLKDNQIKSSHFFTGVSSVECVRELTARP